MWHRAQLSKARYKAGMVRGCPFYASTRRAALRPRDLKWLFSKHTIAESATVDIGILVGYEEDEFYFIHHIACDCLQAALGKRP